MSNDDFLKNHPGLVGKCVYARPTLVGTFHNQHEEECQYTEEIIDATQIDKEIVKEAIAKVRDEWFDKCYNEDDTLNAVEKELGL